MTQSGGIVNLYVYRNVPWVAVQPEHPDNPEAGWTVWTRGLDVNHRVAWIGNLDGQGGPSSEEIAHYVADSHNAQLIDALNRSQLGGTVEYVIPEELMNADLQARIDWLLKDAEADEWVGQSIGGKHLEVRYTEREQQIINMLRLSQSGRTGAS